MSKKDLENIGEIYIESNLRVLDNNFDDNEEEILDDIATIFNQYGEIYRDDDGGIEGSIDNFLGFDWTIDDRNGWEITQYMSVDWSDPQTAGGVTQEELRSFTPKQFLRFVKMHNVDNS